MSESPEHITPEKFSGETEIEKELRLDLSKAEEALHFNAQKKSEFSGQDLQEHPVRFSTEVSVAIFRSWEKLDPEIRNLAKTAFPELAAWILARKIEQKQHPALKLDKDGNWQGEGITIHTR